MQILFAIFATCAGIFLLALVFVWAFWMRRFVESHGQRASSGIFTGAILRDYRVARQIAVTIGHKPGPLFLFERLFDASVAFFLVALLMLFFIPPRT